MGKPRLGQLIADQRDIALQLRALRQADPKSDAVQEQIARHCENIRGCWGLAPGEAVKAAAYKGLAELYVSDERYLAADGRPDPAFAALMRAAMEHYADTKLE
jgi:hypothetical protein